MQPARSKKHHNCNHSADKQTTIDSFLRSKDRIKTKKDLHFNDKDSELSTNIDQHFPTRHFAEASKMPVKLMDCEKGKNRKDREKGQQSIEKYFKKMSKEEIKKKNRGTYQQTLDFFWKKKT